jgi:hypothetical protein
VRHPTKTASGKAFYPTKTLRGHHGAPFSETGGHDAQYLVNHVIWLLLASCR